MPGHRKTLNPRQAAIAAALVGANGEDAMTYAQAARKAGYKNSPYLPQTARQIVKQPIVQAEIDRLRQIARASLKIDADNWHRELAYQYLRYRDTDGTLAMRALEAWAKAVGVYDGHGDSAELVGRLLVALVEVGRPAQLTGTRASEGNGMVVDGAGTVTDAAGGTPGEQREPKPTGAQET